DPLSFSRSPSCTRTCSCPVHVLGCFSSERRQRESGSRSRDRRRARARVRAPCTCSAVSPRSEASESAAPVLEIAVLPPMTPRAVLATFLALAGCSDDGEPLPIVVVAITPAGLSTGRALFGRIAVAGGAEVDVALVEWPG